MADARRISKTRLDSTPSKDRERPVLLLDAQLFAWSAESSLRGGGLCAGSSCLAGAA